MRKSIPIRILILGHADRNQADTIADHLLCFSRHSRHQIRYLDPVGHPLPDWLDIHSFDVIVIHYSIYLLNDYYLGPDWRKQLNNSTAPKVLFLQDEYRRVLAFHHQIRILGIRLLYTCFPPDSISRVYPAERLPDVDFHSTLTGWVPLRLESEPDLSRPRPLDVGYRSRGDGLFWLGEMFHDKGRIGREFQQLTRNSDLKIDISLAEKDRLYGSRWWKFLRNCRVTLGSESGASVVDFTGEVEETTRRYMAENPTADFFTVRQSCFAELDHRIPMGQISPRMFESIASGCALVLFPGKWSGILKEDQHYIRLEKDFSNISEVIDRIQDHEFIRQLAKRTWQEIIASGNWSERAFVNRFDDDMDDLLNHQQKSQPALQTQRTNPGSEIVQDSVPHTKAVGAAPQCWLTTFRMRIRQLLSGFLSLWYYGAFRTAFYAAAPFAALRHRNIYYPLDPEPIRDQGRRWLGVSRQHWLNWQRTPELTLAVRHHQQEATRRIIKKRRQ